MEPVGTTPGSGPDLDVTFGRRPVVSSTPLQGGTLYDQTHDTTREDLNGLVRKVHRWGWSTTPSV